MTAGRAQLVEGLPPPLDGRLAPPRRSLDPVPRARLVQRLRSVPAGSVTLIAAPAGYGKSTLLGQFVAQERRPVAWLSLDERDDDAVVLLHELAYAIGRAAAQHDELLQRLTVGATGVVPLALPRLASWLRGRREPLVIVLDDVHCIRSRDALEVLRALCDNPPGAGAVVLAGRAGPRLPLSRLRAEGRLWDLSASDLRMTVAEGTAMLHAAGADIDDPDAAAVVRRTEGWPAAIYLAALMLRDRSGRGSDLLLGGDDPNFTAYVRDEVLTAVDPEDATFLIRSSVLEELRPDVCDAVLQRTDSDVRLHALAEANLFVTPVDARRHVYRVHGLFRELLRSELRIRPELERELHRRACEIYSRGGVWEQAVRHAVAAADPGRAADLIWQLAPEYVSHGKTETLKRWMSWLSDADVAAHPQAALARGWAAFEEGDADMAVHCAAITLGADPDRTLADGERLHPLGLVLRAAIATHGLRQAMEDAARADAGLSPENPLRGIAKLIMGSGAMLYGQTERARLLLGQAEELAAGRLTTLYALALAQQALVAIEHGRWNDADAVMNRAWSFQRAVPIRDYSSQGIVSAVRALTLAHCREVAWAREEADRAARNLAMRAVVPWLALETRLVIARARAELGDSARAHSLLDESRSRIEQDGAPLLRAWAARVTTALERLRGDAATGPALTTAELRTLQYLPTHLSFAEIGERLYVTRNTVKTHAISIYRKLDVNSRTEAVERGREIGLLDL